MRRVLSAELRTGSMRYLFGAHDVAGQDDVDNDDGGNDDCNDNGNDKIINLRKVS